LDTRGGAVVTTFTVYYQFTVEVEAEDDNEAGDRADKMLDALDGEGAKRTVDAAVWIDTIMEA
jgi:hypothetical protein